MLPHFAQSLTYAFSLRFPFNGSIKLLQNMHSRGPMEQHFYVWEPRCGYLHEVKRANGAINMHSKVLTNRCQNIDPPYRKMVSYPLIEKGQRSHKYAFLRVSGAMLLRLGASSWVPPQGEKSALVPSLKRANGAINMHSRGPTEP